MKCAFIGFEHTSDNIVEKLEETIVDLIKNYGVDIFYIGNHYDFDIMMKKLLCSIKHYYPNITYQVIFAYLPGEKEIGQFMFSVNAFYPNDMEDDFSEKAIIKRNEWMLNNADFVVYVTINGEIKIFKNIS